MSEDARKEEEKITDEDLLEKVDTEFETKLRKIYLSGKLPFSYYLRLALPFFSLLGFLIVGYLLLEINSVLPSGLSKATPSEALTVLLAMVAALISLLSLSVVMIDFAKSEKESDIPLLLLTYNYIVLKKTVPSKKLPLLKALVMLKSKQPEISLKKFLHSPLDKSLTEKKLFEILYE